MSKEMLNYFIENNLVQIVEKTPQNWQEAVRVSCQKLLEKNYITNDYVDKIITNVIENGPYIVIVPGIAMPHSEAENAGVLGTGIGFTKFADNVIFDEHDATKNAQLFFTLAAKDPKQHLENISNLMGFLADDQLINKLKTINSYAELELLATQ
ncbi:PTS sugar transporter subunit IIA [Periweissella beninensis]|nr:PTS sugar transporter subunit IIA [Periweissella beninensis]MBM7544739.1 PTS system ascorbate-specific IIA component [Periweissella beninensis]